MGALSLVGVASTPYNTTKAGNHIRLRIREAAVVASPIASPFSGGPLAALVITNAQLQAAAPRGNLRRLFRARDEAVANSGLTAAALTQAQARALLNSQDSSPATPTVLLSNRTARATLCIAPAHSVGATGLAAKPPRNVYTADVSVDASGRPTILVRCSLMRGSGPVAPASPWSSPVDAFLDIRFESQLVGR